MRIVALLARHRQTAGTKAGTTSAGVTANASVGNNRL